MTDTDKQSEQSADLRRRAEAMAGGKALSTEDFATLPPEEIHKTFHELHVHQIELEMQNEELRRAQSQLEAIKERYCDLYDLAPVGYVTVSEKGLIEEANLTAANLLGMPRARLLKQPLSRFICKEDQDIYYFARKNDSDLCKPRHIELRMVRQDGLFWAKLMITSPPRTTGAFECRLALCDITERKQMEEALRQSEERRSQAQATANALLKEQADSLASIYYALDSIGLIIGELEESDCRVTIFNSGAEKLLGYRRDEIVGKSITLIYPPELLKNIPEGIKRLRQGESMQSFDRTMVRKSGERFPAVISLHPFDAHEGRFRKVVGVFRDISELMIALEQLKTANIELESRVEQRTRELQESQKHCLHVEKLSAIGQLSASIAHEFNNPLQGILSVLKGLKKRAILENEDRELLEAAVGEGDRIKDLIRSLQEFNRPSTGRQTVVDVHKSLDSILLLHKSDFNGKRIAVVRNYAEELPRILAVPDQIKQVFLNLLTNAADACQRSGGEITISTWEEGDRVAVAIKDTGVGIKPKEMERIFQPFYSTKAAVKGTGLGLSVCHGIVKQHQGEIRVESRPGEGATFTVLLPVAGVGDPVSAIEREV